MKMQRWKSGDSSKTVLLSLSVLYVLLISLVLFFSSQMVSDLARNRARPGSLILVIAVGFCLFLLGTIVYYIVRLFRNRAAGKAGVRFKFRLVFFFIVIIVLSSIPQGILSINFINTAMHSWFSTKIGEALKGGLSIAMEYYNEKVAGLANLTKNRYAMEILEDAAGNPKKAWESLKVLNPQIDAFQIFSADNKPKFSAGNSTAFIDEDNLFTVDGLLPRETKSPGFTILRSKKTIESGGDRFIVVVSIMLPREFDRHAEELTSTIETFSQLDRYRAAFLLAVALFYAFFSFPLLLLAVLVSFLLSDEIIRPIVNLEEATQRVAEGDFSYRILSRSKDELSQLSASFNKMVAELEKSRSQLLQTEKVAAWQEIAQRLAHEIKNPLTPIKLSAQRIVKRYRENPEDFDRVLDASITAIIREVDNLDSLLTEFRNFSRLPAPQKEPVALKGLVLQVISTYRNASERISFDVEGIGNEVSLFADPGQLKQVFVNLVKNAIDAMPSGGTIRFRSDLVKKGNTKYCRIQVEDTGEGIRREHFNQAFNPYFTTKSHGTGLGLSIVERIVFDHKGQVWFESEIGVGTTFFIDLPAERIP